MAKDDLVEKMAAEAVAADLPEVETPEVAAEIAATTVFEPDAPSPAPVEIAAPEEPEVAEEPEEPEVVAEPEDETTPASAALPAQDDSTDGGSA